MILTNHSDVVALFTTYTLEDGSIVKINKQLAFECVRTSMNTLKKTCGCSLISTSANTNKENEWLVINFVVKYIFLYLIY